MKINIPQKTAQILKTLNAAGYEPTLWADASGIPSWAGSRGDWDITTSALPEQVKELFENRRYGNPAWNSNGNDG
mgnify:CR=1 FL=1